jgi:anti-sigma factor RsiW
MPEHTHQHDRSCKEVFALLSEYLDAELPGDACADFEEHIKGCAPCVAFVESLRKTIDLCHGFSPEQLPAPLTASAKDQLFQAYQKAIAQKKT